jgi:hypothetical protein
LLLSFFSPNLIYAGGQNNGASSGVLKSTDQGKTWSMASNGLYDTHVQALGIADWDGLLFSFSPDPNLQAARQGFSTAAPRRLHNAHQRLQIC